jgi:hypothetical protein
VSFETIIFGAWLGTLVIVVLGAFALVLRNKDPQFKRKWFPRYVAGATALLVFSTTAFVVSAPASGWFYLGAAAFQAYLVFLAYGLARWTGVCDHCGRVSLSATRPRRLADQRCWKCGSPLDSPERPIRLRLSIVTMVVGLLALMVTGWLWVAATAGRRALYYDRARYYSRERFEESGARFAAALRAEGNPAGADRLEAMLGSRTLTPAMINSLAAQFEAEVARRGVNADATRRRDFLRAMQAKYEAATLRPWNTVPLDPPEPPRN